jgi:hypothetical protein
MRFNLSFAEDGQKRVVQASALNPPESIWAARYSSRDEAEKTLKSERVIATESALPTPGSSMHSEDISDQALINAGFLHAVRA